MRKEFDRSAIRMSAKDAMPPHTWVNPPFGWVSQLAANNDRFEILEVGRVENESGAIESHNNKRPICVAIKNRATDPLIEGIYQRFEFSKSGTVDRSLRFIVSHGSWERGFGQQRKLIEMLRDCGFTAEVLRDYGRSEDGISVSNSGPIIGREFAAQHYWVDCLKPAVVVWPEDIAPFNRWIPIVTLDNLDRLAPHYVEGSCVALARFIDAKMTPELLAQPPKKQADILSRMSFPEIGIVSNPDAGVTFGHYQKSQHGFVL